MAGKDRQASGEAANIAAASLCLVGLGVSPAMAGAAVVIRPDSGDWLQTETIWELLIGGFVVASFLAAVALWTMTKLRRLRRAHYRKNLVVNSVLNNLRQGLVIIDPHDRLVFCNDRFLEIYGLSRRDVPECMTGAELLRLRRARGTLDISTEDFYRNASSPKGHIAELPDGRSVLVKLTQLPNGGSVATHDDCTEQRRLSHEVATTKQFLESVVDNIPVCIAAKSLEDGRYILANRAFEDLVRLSRGQIVGKRADEIFSPNAAKSIKEADQAALAAPERRLRIEFPLERDDKMRLLESNRVIARNDKNQPEFLITLLEDVTDRRSMSAEFERAKKFLELVVDNVPVSLTVQDVTDGRYLLANRSAEIILNRRREDAIGLNCADIFNAKEARLISDRDAIAIKKRKLQTEEHPISTKDGLRLFLTRRMTVLDGAGAPQYLIKTHEDVTDRRQTESRMAHMAYHDGLTDLPNRLAFMQALAQMIEACKSVNEEFAVLSVDLDGLKEINDVFDHAIGDRLLIEVSRRIETASRGGVVARLSGDEFGLIIDGPQPASARELAERVAAALATGFTIDGKSVRIGVTTGISVFPGNGTDAASLLANAGAALFRAKVKSRGSVQLFEPEMDQQIRDRRALHQDLSNAIRNGELSLHYQPQASSRERFDRTDIIGFEALARWHHPERGMVPPAEFIPLAEESGLIVEMGEWILREACREAASWSRPLQVAVNLSPAQFVKTDLVAFVHRVLLETGLKPSRLELEITEGVLIDDFDRGLALLRRLTALGVRVSMDDFGSGYSSLTYLQAFPFNKIKIDRAFIMNLGRNPQSAAIVRAVINLGHGLGVSIVAEGVETRAQLDFLVAEHCDAVQGYFIGRPGPIEQYAALVGPAADQSSRMIG
ncbi:MULTISPECIES: EAL domain-containing protein [Rhodopseudomonas]|uniref:Diguanylate cyclase n=1 Tax=Rhodopseudomonas palustris TaxID=1076 RepID=A0A0D7EW89_RHOPL|nr:MULTISPECIES: EAL domain-containing protein [Rhodopseudomonas]KIZ45068.1 diguanylate cyclase [Rhodopseudomonas palustris]MDF3813498.1 EAL domain-containing protein [Rhodopseudomonas sp. BAL398]WOK15352.1 EAL domain-containing protein [Rhodopseudomonas sp. BAL398]